jgi:hypothetical protein
LVDTMLVGKFTKLQVGIPRLNESVCFALPSSIVPLCPYSTGHAPPAASAGCKRRVQMRYIVSKATVCILRTQTSCLWLRKVPLLIITCWNVTLPPIFAIFFPIQILGQL